MNKLTTLIVLFLLAGYMGVNAQESTTTPVSSYPMIINKIKKSEKDLVNPKKNVSPKYWVSRANIMMDAYNVNRQYLLPGTYEVQVTMLYGDPKETKTEEKEGKLLKTFVYDRVNVTIGDGVVQSFEETDPLHQDPLPVAKEALDKAVDLDEDNKLTKKIKEAYIKLSGYYTDQGVEFYVKDNYKSAFESFEQRVLIGQIEMLSDQVDSAYIVSIFNTGFCAAKADLNEESIKYYELAISNDYPQAGIYVNLKNAYLAKSDSSKAEETLLAGFNKFSDSQEVVTELINYYLSSGKGDQAFEYVQIAKENDPGNVSLIFVEAMLYDKQGETEKAIETYKKCIEVDPEYFNAYYNLGVVYYNYAQKILDDASSASDSEYAEMKVKAKEQLKKAIPMMKKCYELNPDEIESLRTLKSIYFSLEMNDEYEATKALLEE